MTRITVDVGPLFEPRWTGIPVFTRRLVQALTKHGAVEVDFAYNLTRVPAELVWSAIAAGTGSFMRDAYHRFSYQWEQVEDPSEHLLYPTVKTAIGFSRNEASTIHDMSTLLLPEFHVQANIDFHLAHLPREVASNARTFCISDATESAFLSAYPSQRGRIGRITQYVDWPEYFAAYDRNLPPIQLGPYAVVIGTIEPRKNLDLLFRALRLAEMRKSTMKFVVIGPRGWKVDETLAQIDADIAERVVFSGFVSEFIKYRLIRGCEFLIFPSVYEGFGIPALEAMSLGKPVLSTISSSLPEVVGDAGVYFDPLSPGEFAAAFTEISAPTRLAELSARAVEGAGAFGWERMAAPVVEWACG